MEPAQDDTNVSLLSSVDRLSFTVTKPYPRHEGSAEEQQRKKYKKIWSFKHTAEKSRSQLPNEKEM